MDSRGVKLNAEEDDHDEKWNVKSQLVELKNLIDSFSLLHEAQEVREMKAKDEDQKFRSTSRESALKNQMQQGDEMEKIKIRNKKQQDLIDSMKLTIQMLDFKFSISKVKIQELKVANDSMKLELQKQDKVVKGIKAENAEHKASIDSMTIKLKKQEDLLSVLSCGPYLWRIDNVSVKTEAAKRGEAEALFSEAFYSRRFGYQLEAWVYLNGSGEGEGTHLSIFYKLIPGAYDSLLKWPFSLSVTFTLYDQVADTSKAVNSTETISVDGMALEDRLPTAESGWGYPKFISHEELKKRQYAKDNTMFIRISVDDPQAS